MSGASGMAGLRFAVSIGAVLAGFALGWLAFDSWLLGVVFGIVFGGVGEGVQRAAGATRQPDDGPDGESKPR